MAETKETKEKSIFVGRPSIASKLLEMGYNGQKVVNPYDTKRPGWVFTGDEKLFELINDLKAKGVR